MTDKFPDTSHKYDQLSFGSNQKDKFECMTGRDHLQSMGTYNLILIQISTFHASIILAVLVVEEWVCWTLI